MKGNTNWSILLFIFMMVISVIALTISDTKSNEANAKYKLQEQRNQFVLDSIKAVTKEK